jgi:hypothetical protein
MELFKAHEQWAKRPVDERFPSLQALYAACKAYAETAVEAETPFNSLRTENVDGDLVLIGRSNVPAKLTNWAFGQLAQRAGAPAGYLATLPPTLASQNVNYGLKRRQEQNPRESDNANILLHRNGGMLCRALTTEKYERIWNWEVAQRLLALGDQGWEPAKPDYEQSETDFPALYASDRDMFAFVRLPNITIPQPVKSQRGDSMPMYKGLIYWNSEVGDKKIGCMKFLYNGMCGNHIIWGASEVAEFSARHVGNVRGALRNFEFQIKRYANESVSELEAQLQSAHTKVIASTKEGVLDYLFGQRSVGLSRKVIDASYDAVVPEQDGPANTVWGFVQGLTRHSQTIPYADQRQALDRASAKVLKIAF